MGFIPQKDYATQPTPINGGRYFSFTSAADPYGSFYVECDKHPGKKIAVPFRWSMKDDITLLDNLYAALETCEGCVDEKAHLSSRWPNAGMPGGAEL